MHEKVKMPLAIDAIKTDPNLLGELLREITFVGEGYSGYYENFDIRKDAREWSKEERLIFVREICPHIEEDECVFPHAEGYTYEKDEMFIDVFWYCDGDSDLTFRIRTKDGKIARIINNPDSKKDYGWRGIN